MKRGTPDSPKFKRLCRILKVSAVQGVGHLELLWHFAADYAQPGDIGKWSDEDIADACGWDGDAGAFVDALVLARWLDPCRKHRLVVHDWAQHTDNATKRSLQRADAVARCVAEKDGIPQFARPTGIPEELRESWRAFLARQDDVGSCCDSGSTTELCVETESRQNRATRPHQAPPHQTRPRTPESRARARDDGEDQGQGQDLDAKAVATRKAALAIADDWRPLRRKVDPADPITADDDAWSLAREEQAGQVVRLLQAGHPADLIRSTLTWAMHDGGDGGRWKGWRYQLATLADLYRHFPAIRKAMLAAQAPAAPPPDPPPRPGRGPEPPARVRQTLTPAEIVAIESRLEVITPAQAAAARAAREAKHPGGAP